MVAYEINPFPAPPPYDENIIVNLIEEIYKILILLCYIDAAHVAFAPPEGHAIDEMLCLDLGIDARVISLMKRLPYFSVYRKARPIFPPTVRPLIYTQADHIRAGRSPTNFMLQPEDRDESHLLPHEFAFFAGSTRSESWILDVEENAIRQVHPMTNYSPARTPRGPTDHRFARALSAPHLLSEYVSQLRALQFMPDPAQPGIFDIEAQENERSGVTELLKGPRNVKKRLLDEYGWPDAFRSEDWARDHERVWYESRGLAEAEEQRWEAIRNADKVRAEKGLHPVEAMLRDNIPLWIAEKCPPTMSGERDQVCVNMLLGEHELLPTVKRQFADSFWENIKAMDKERVKEGLYPIYDMVRGGMSAYEALRVPPPRPADLARPREIGKYLYTEGFWDDIKVVDKARVERGLHPIEDMVRSGIPARVAIDSEPPAEPANQHDEL
ncbi:hypothetical protein GQ53DRAFT_740700 [Thozetella sp. PMI_491]|nr:hypothetical protein GQ53DRAFT_740700 [Thozetella sp. PMI_491]